MPREARQARNEALFREVNQRIAELSANLGADELPILCECATLGCQTMISVPSAEYHRVRGNPRMFFIFPGHDVSEIEDVVERHDAYQVVEKHDDVVLHVFNPPPP